MALTTAVKSALDNSDMSLPPAISELLKLLDAWRQIIGAIDACKFACIETGDSEAFELMDAIQRREWAELEELRRAVQNLVATRCRDSQNGD